MTAFLFLTIFIFLFLLIFIMPRVLYFSTLIYYALKKKKKRMGSGYALASLKETQKKKIVL